MHQQDVLHRFLIERAGVRGVLVRLHDSWRDISASAEYPEEVARNLAEALAAVALFGGHTKVEGQLSLQLRGSQSLRTVFAEYRHPGLLRGIAHWQDPISDPLTPRQFGDDALLALTVEARLSEQRDPVRYQGLVSLDADSLAEACENYFTQSEQLPTKLILVRRGNHVAGIMLQILPGEEGDLDGWQRAQTLLDTLSEDELFDLSAEQLLYRLFHEDNVRLFAEQPLRFECTCSRERVSNMLQGLGEEEATACIQADDLARVTCEFCGQNYAFDRIDIATLFKDAAPNTNTSH